ncbi:unnamed protein product [Hymenolepis diminuta]|uniref:DUF7083 domain-containing protein n=1 Tax=Hymenolepis diminuta TaxID=6216 RepID=A0A564YTI9_HYMDI|nr:unnamed protein product [Hymenolepis diminuta]
MDSTETAKITAVFRCIVEQMNLSKPDKDPEDYIKNIGEFQYEPSVGEIFTAWYTRNRDVYENRMAGLPNETRINMLLQKFSKSDHDLYLAHLIPFSPKDLMFEEMIEKCEKVLDDNTSLFSRRFKCLNLTIREVENIHKCTAVVNRMSNAFSYGSLKEDQFRNLDIMLHHLLDAYNNFWSLITDSNMVESSEIRVCQIKKPEIDPFPENNPNPQSQLQRQHTYPKNNKPKRRFCGDFHFYRDCPFYRHQCQDCNSYGHKEGFCIQTTRQAIVGRRRYVTICINGRHIAVSYNDDTGSDITTVSDEAWKSLGSA